MFMGLLTRTTQQSQRRNLSVGTAASEAFLPFVLGGRQAQPVGLGNYYPLQTSRNQFSSIKCAIRPEIHPFGVNRSASS
jgi:hypothetical protein